MRPAAGAERGLLSPPAPWAPAAAPRIVSLSVLPGPAHAFRALCTAEGEPPPVLAWSGPALGNRSAAASGPGQGHGHQVTAELPALAHDGRYTCTASNSLGRAEASVYLFRFRGAPGAPALALPLGALGLKALLLLGVLAARAAARRRRGGCTLGPGGGEGPGGALLLGNTVRRAPGTAQRRHASCTCASSGFVLLLTSQEVGTSRSPFYAKKVEAGEVKELASGLETQR